MLKKPLILSRDIKQYCEDNYDYNETSNINDFLDENSHIVSIYLDTIDNKEVPGHFYHDTKLNKGTIDSIDVALSLKKETILTGYYLVSLLGWTEYLPKVIHIEFLRRSQRSAPKTPIDNHTLQQIAFRDKKKTQNSFLYGDSNIVLLNGKYLSENEQSHIQYVPKDINVPSYAKMYIPERLIIEALINYHYFGGQDIVWEMGLSIFKSLDLNRMLQILLEMDLKYPYANALGYWMETAGVSNKILSKWEPQIDRSLQFHLFLGDKERRIWIDKWSVYVPKRFHRS